MNESNTALGFELSAIKDTSMYIISKLSRERSALNANFFGIVSLAHETWDNGISL
jgi:hypothetical protein